MYTKSLLTTLAALMLTCMLTCSLSAQNAEKVDYAKYPDYQSGFFAKEVYAPQQTTTEGKQKAPRTLPRRVHNGEKSFFPAVFNQDAGSCGSASRIGYMFTAEINAFRNLSAAQPKNVYPTHFTWLLTEHGPGKEGMARDNGIPCETDYGGRTYSKLFGYQENHNPFGWMTGYGKWYRAMFNRISHNSQILTLKNQENAERLKGWLYDHNGDPDFGGRGGVAGIGVASACTTGNIKEGEFKGQKFVKYWGESVDHALTIVGYDDDIWCDINDNNLKDPDETGAWIIVNSWGPGWANGGFIYCPYSQAKAAKNSPDFWWPELYHVRKNYKPQKTIKIKMTYSHRSELDISVGISTDLNATKPQISIPLSHFTYCGWQIIDGVKQHNVPMLGQWADKQMHTETMEFGYDLTDLTASYDYGTPLKYFLIIKSSTAANGEGAVEYCSIVDYSLNPEGIETSFEANNKTILNKGKTTTLATTVYSEPINSPLNLTWSAINTELTWQRPQLSSVKLAGYKIYENNQTIATLDAANTKYTLTSATENSDTKYTVSALYTFAENEVESQPSNVLKKIPQALPPAITETGSINWRGSGFTIKNIFTKPMDECTIEFWMKPTSVTDWNFQIGQTWEAGFLFHLNAGGGITAGYNTGNRVDKISQAVVGKWTHIALVMNRKDFIVYQDGKQIGRIAGTGMPAIADFVVGRSGNGLNGYLDEFRVWKEARSASEINSMKDRLITYPSQYPNLIAYYQMNKTADGLLADAVQNNNAPITGTVNLSAPTDYPLKGGENNFELTKATYFIGEKVEIKNATQPANIVRTTWNTPDITETAPISMIEGFPCFVFDKAGTFTITKAVETAEKIAPDVVSKTVVISEYPTPEADFRMNKTTIETGERLSLTSNVNAAPTFTYEWTMEGGTPATASTVNTYTVYNQSGMYTITLKIKNGNTEKSVSKTITVEMSAPVADFNSDKNYLLKGGQITFADQSLLSPTAWKWHFEGADKLFSYVQNPTVTYNFAGKYKVSLTASNSVGESTATKERYIAVANEDPKRALYFSGGTDYLTITPTLDATPDVARITIEWWMSVNKYKENTPIFSTPTQPLLTIGENGGGTITVLNNEKIILPDGTFTEGVWEHYALMTAGTRVNFYKNGILVKSATAQTSPTPKTLGLTEQLRIGNQTNTLNGAIDEVRVWRKSLTPTEILTGLNQGITDPATKTDLDVYLKFDEEATDSPLNSSACQRTTKRHNIGPVGDMWGASQAFTAFNYAPKAFTPEAACTYKITRTADEKLMNVTANTSWAEFKAEFIPDGSITPLCVGEKSADKNKYGIANKYVLTGTDEYRLEKNSGQWIIKNVNTDLYVRADAGFMIPLSDISIHKPYFSFDKNETGNVRIKYGTNYMAGIGNEWNFSGDMLNFGFRFEEIKTIDATGNFADLSDDANLQIRFTPASQLSGEAKTINGRVSYANILKTNEWQLISFPEALENIRFIGKALQTDTVRLGGKLTQNTDYQILQFVDGKFGKPVVQGGIIPKGSYLFRIINPALNDKTILFETVSGVTFGNSPAAPLHNTACGSNMARTASTGVMNGYYVINADRTLLTLQAGAPETIAPFAGYIPYIGNIAAAPQTLDPTKAITDLTGVESHNYCRPDIKVWVTNNGTVKVKGSDAPFRVFSITGVELPAHKQLTKGCYIIQIEGVSFKVIAM